MNPVLKNILAVVAGVVLGSVINMGLIMVGHNVIPPPLGFDPMDPDSLAAHIHLFQNKHFVFPFLAHALGTLAGAFVTLKIANHHGHKLALGIGAWFLLGGIMNAFMISAPTWFVVLDLVVAYLPMAFLAIRLGRK